MCSKRVTQILPAVVEAGAGSHLPLGLSAKRIILTLERALYIYGIYGKT